MVQGIVIIPTFNEIENIEAIIKAVLALPTPFHVLIVDDNSPDGTADKVREMQSEFPTQLHLKVRTKKSGLGTAYVAGFKWALSHGYEYIFEMDADFSHNPDDLIRLYNACFNGADVSIGSRYTKGGKVQNWPMGRILMSYFASVYVRMILFIGISDTTAGFMCYSSKVLRAIDLDNIHFKGYAFQIEMKFASWRLGFKLKEVPITFVDRKIGVSKMSKGIVKEAAFGVIKLKLWSIFRGKKGYNNHQ